MNIDKKKIKRFTENTALLLALAAGSTIAINEHTTNHNDKVCMLTRILGYQHQIMKIDTDQDNIKNGVFAEYSDKYYIIPDDYVFHRDDERAYQKSTDGSNSDINNDYDLAQRQDNIIAIRPSFYNIPNIEIFKHNSETGEDELVKALRLK